jgi:tetratricopeptide (TPR) repeat protein
LEQSVAADGGLRLAGLRLPLARTLAVLGREPEAIRLLEGLRASDAAEAVRTEASELVADLAAGKGLFSRATELVGNLALEPPSKPLAKADRARLLQGAEWLREASARRASFVNVWYLAKVELRLGNFAQAALGFEQACTIEPDDANGHRELCSAYLELDRARDALPAARRALELRPSDATLRCNLALVQLLNGALDDARDEIRAALTADPSDPIARLLVEIVDDVRAGRRRCPTSLAELEGRAK